MSQGKRANIGHSIFQKLLNHARTSSVDFNLLLIRYGTERLLYRLSASPHKGNFILKGASLFLIWMGQTYRVTKDLDLLGFGEANTATIARFFKSLCQMSVKTNDGIQFLPETVRAAPIREDNLYDGIRVTLLAILHQARIPLQIDIGFGDAVHPDPKEYDFPTLLNFPSPRLLCYSRESAISEKFEAIMKLGMLNSRMKDFYDIWLLSRLFDFDGESLKEAIRLTFERRGTKLPVEIEAFTKPFIEAKQTQWSAFCKRLRQEAVPASFAEITTSLDRFLSPVIDALVSGSSNPTVWTAPGPWA